MIKLNHLSEHSMDLVMGLSREFKEKPDVIIKTLLDTITYKDAKRAINDYKEDTKK